ncbi:MAG: NADH-quinone oxidoreductase subunit F [Rhodospirillales bacterium]|jgi:formate dehydrogenase beta subunit|nr:NADH-quinone oxidoreductase subunit F [Rhodospirillales bacterium]MBT4039992.1 NADH-quinone oxidoreductase subunit F [Rhodospirillales bacterium]MBT4625838.1 NADH-quinone oxidoreductase subunit F [Rhodospirillales bacterium]MBT5351654.1 NADH-quinone oxidoreductase subunit F [Rhodospirillales bacterium]MBT5521331.1 NADH-quinone oxidoreductase subunit F [Rhodospirillales bacterium]
MNKSDAGRKIHPGSGRRKAPIYNKGRQVDPQASEDIQILLGDRPRRRDLLIEHLHLIQDKFGHLSAQHLAALAAEMGISMSEVYEVASFYAHFDIVLEGETAPAPITIRVCDSLSCEMAGSVKLMEELAAKAPDDVRVVRAPCMGRCDSAPVAEVGHNHVGHATAEGLLSTADAGDVHPAKTDYVGYDAYVADGGYALLNKCLAGDMDAEDIVKTMQDSGLRGLGGAGFPSGLKWKIVRDQPKPRLFAVNGDEGEPGTFKDRYYLERNPHQFLEGTLVAAWTCEIETVYIYIRDEYPGIIHILESEIARLQAEGLTGGIGLEVRRGAGAYICGEESAMIESIEGKRGLPRNRPPFPSERGLFQRPTLTHNIETMYWVRDILNNGPEWFSSQGKGESKGFRSYSVSGRVKSPGVKLAPAGVTVRELINDYCDGMAEGHEFNAYLPGGASGGILPASKGDLPLDFGGELGELGCFVGSHAVIVLSQKDSVKDAALNLMRFFEDESCGQCTPCRNGTAKAAGLMAKDKWDVDLLNELKTVMMDASICGLGQAAPNPMLSVMKFFPEEV